MALYKVIDNYLPEQVHKHLYNYCVFSETPMWQFMPCQTTLKEMGKEQCQFIIPIQNDIIGLRLKHESIQSLFKKIDAYVYLRTKLNCTLKTETHKESTYHTDFEGALLCMTAIYYVNTNNGYTQFEHDGSKIDSVANRIVMFPSSLKHRGVTTTDTPYRMVMNINYHPKPLS